MPEANTSEPSPQDRIIAFLKERSLRGQSFDRLHNGLFSSGFETFEVAAVLNNMLRRGVIQVSHDGFGFTLGDCALPDALMDAKAALVGDSNDAEHDAFVGIMMALGFETPDCECDGATIDVLHAEGCPCYAWQQKGGN